MNFFEWGVDSAENVTEDLFQCVVNNFGYPDFWGRYLVRVPNISEGLTRQEISFLRSRGVKILPIYNSFREAMGYDRGLAAAGDAVLRAQSLDMPEGTPLFANVERFFQIDGDWIRGWTEAVMKNGYRSGFYNDPVTGGFSRAFCDAVKENETIRELSILWSAQPETEPSGPQAPPDYNPIAPDCGGNVWVWQYSRNVASCPIDTDIACGGLTGILW